MSVIVLVDDYHLICRHLFKIVHLSFKCVAALSFLLQVWSVAQVVLIVENVAIVVSHGMLVWLFVIWVLP